MTSVTIHFAPYDIKQVFSILSCVCSVIYHRGRKHAVKTSMTHSATASRAKFLFLPHSDVICDLLLNRCTATWNLFINLSAFTMKKIPATLRAWVLIMVGKQSFDLKGYSIKKSSFYTSNCFEGCIS